MVITQNFSAQTFHIVSKKRNKNWGDFGAILEKAWTMAHGF